MSSINEKLTRIDSNISNLKNTLGLEATDPIESIKIPSIKNCAYLFEKSNRWDEFDTICKLTQEATDMSHMFSSAYGNPNIPTNIDFGKLNTGNVTNMSYMFAGANSGPKIDTSNWDVKNVTSTYRMFYNCRITEIDFTAFDISQIETNTFNGCYATRVYVKNEAIQQKILSSNYKPSGWTTANVIVKE